MSHNDEMFGNWSHQTLVDWSLQHDSERENKAEDDCYMYFKCCSNVKCSNLKTAVVHLQINVEQIFMQGWTAQLDSRHKAGQVLAPVHTSPKRSHIISIKIKYKIYPAYEISHGSLMNHDVINLRWIQMLSDPKYSRAKSTKNGLIYMNICIGKIRASWTDHSHQ